MLIHSKVNGVGGGPGKFCVFIFSVFSWNLQNESGMAIEDRVAFACTFLSNSKLHDYLMTLTETLVSEGDLAGILLTGATVEAVPLLQHYLDHTGDLQSVGLIAVNTFHTSLLEKDSRVESWVTRSVLPTL